MPLMTLGSSWIFAASAATVANIAQLSDLATTPIPVDSVIAFLHPALHGPRALYHFHSREPKHSINVYAEAGGCCQGLFIQREDSNLLETHGFPTLISFAAFLRWEKKDFSPPFLFLFYPLKK